MSTFSGALTGDSTNLTMYIAVGAIALILLIVILFIKRRRK